MAYKHHKKKVNFKKKKVNVDTKKRKFKKKKGPYMNLHVRASFKNTILNLTSKTGNLLKQWSTKSLKKTSFKKNTPYNIQYIVNKLNQILKFKHVQRLHLFFNGTGYGRRHIIRNLKKDLKILSLSDITPRPFNGCRLKKKKRR